MANAYNPEVLESLERDLLKKNNHTALFYRNIIFEGRITGFGLQTVKSIAQQVASNIRDGIMITVPPEIEPYYWILNHLSEKKQILTPEAAKEKLIALPTRNVVFFITEITKYVGILDFLPLTALNYAVIGFSSSRITNLKILYLPMPRRSESFLITKYGDALSEAVIGKIIELAEGDDNVVDMLIMTAVGYSFKIHNTADLSEPLPLDQEVIFALQQILNYNS